MNHTTRQATYQTPLDVLDHHGLIVFVLYWVSELFSLASVSFWLRRLPFWLRRSPRKFLNISSAYDAESDRVKPWWQDIVFLLVLIPLTPLAVALAWSPSPKITPWGSLLSAYLVFDAAIYFLRVLWFDDLRPGLTNLARGVSSHRRILFAAILSFGQSIILFPSMYRWVTVLSNSSYPSLLERSFSNATLLTLGQPVTILDVVQISLSLFFLAIVIATMASISYQRHEFSEEDTNEKSRPTPAPADSGSAARKPARFARNAK